MSTPLPPPTPAAVRAALEHAKTDTEWARTAVVGRDYETQASADRRYLADHIRAITAEMRAESIAMHVNTHDPFVEPGTREAEITAAKLLAVFADRLEGRES